MLKIASLTLLAAIVATASPALAKDTKPADPAPSEMASSAQPSAKPTRYCIIETPTGSILTRKTCHTRSEWMNLGFDPLAKK